MKLIRLKITDPEGFRSLPCGFEHHFRTERGLQDELAETEDFAPFVCAGPNGSGKSNLLEALAAIFFQLEVMRVRRSFLPEALQSITQEFSPVAFELDYIIRVPQQYRLDKAEWARVSVWKDVGESVRFQWENHSDFDTEVTAIFEGGHADILLPQYVLGYSSGENEILSLPFFKTRFVQYDEYWNALTKQLPYPGHPETRLTYLDNSFSQAILLCNLLFQNKNTLQAFREDIGIDELQEFRIVVRRSIPITRQQLSAFTSGDYALPTNSEDGSFVDTDAVYLDPKTGDYRLNLLRGLEGSERTQNTSIIEKLKRCATLYFHDETSDTLIFDYWINDSTKEAFRANFDDSPVALFQALQILLALNLYPVGEALKSDLYTSNSHYVSETVPTLASDQRIMRFKFVRFTKKGVSTPMMLKDLSDGEHQFLHSLGLCLLFRETNSLFLLDEPETHFNPNWRAKFISRLRKCFPQQSSSAQEMLITTHSPFLISDSPRKKVLVFEKDKLNGEVRISNPEYETLGASINLISVNTFEKRETIGKFAIDELKKLLESPELSNDPLLLAKRIMGTLGDSIERSIAIQDVLSRGKREQIGRENN